LSNSSTNSSKWIVLGSVLMAISIVLGALAAHALSKLLTEQELNSFTTGVNYLSYQALGLILVGIISKIYTITLRNSALLMLWGVTLFSGSIFLLVLVKHTSLNGLSKVLGPTTPIGGLLMITGWIHLAWITFKKLKKQ
jgi:uncharacterized membrane protein YgdD (TMEM256/DUF423 family)